MRCLPQKHAGQEAAGGWLQAARPTAARNGERYGSEKETRKEALQCPLVTLPISTI
jgi:hypothetical protein